MRPRIRRIAKGARGVGPWALAGCVLATLLLGGYDSLEELSLFASLLLAALGLFACLLFARFVTSRSRADRGGGFREAELGALLLVGAFALIEPHGRLDNPVYPLLYLLMAFITTSSKARLTVGLTLLAMGIETSLFFARGTDLGAWPFLASRLFFLSAFAWLPRLALALEAASTRLSGKWELERREQARREEARRLRLSSAGAPKEEGTDVAAWASAAVAELEEAVTNTLEVAALALDARSVSVFLLDQEDPRHLWLFAARPRRDDWLRKRFDAQEGLLGVAAKRREPLRLCGELRGVTWHDGKEPIPSVLIVPLRDDRRLDATGRGAFRGLLVADRLEAVPFEDRDEQLLLASSREILRAVESEFVMVQMRKDRERARNTRLAIEKFNRSTRLEEVYETAIAEVRTFFGEHPKDLVAVTTVLVDDRGRISHRLERIQGAKGLEKIQGKVFPDGNCLVSQAVRHRATLPERSPQRAVRIFGEDTLIRGVNSLKVLPLKMGTEVLGSLVFGSEKRTTLEAADVDTLELLASQVAQSLQRATFYAQAEALAEKDGLTGLTNRRVFEERLVSMMNLAKRSGRPLAVIVADIDHFKTVNDTYGHLTGDEILRKVAEILQRSARNTDVVARYGGEEFTLLLSDTDMEGGKVTAERIREEVEGTTFATGLGPLRCTLSLGIAAYPQVPEEELIEQADQALYHCKRMGRNCSATVDEMRRYDAEQKVRASSEG